MRPFVFRAQPALDLRRTEEEAAERALALAESDARQAEQLTRDAGEALAAAAVRARAVVGVACAAHELLWHRNWMTGLEHAIERARIRERERRAVARAAAIRAQEARRAVRTLERLRERAWRTWHEAARREDQKALDLLGSLQYAVRTMHREEHDA